MTIESRLTSDQQAEANEFLDRLSPWDRTNMEEVLGVIQGLTIKYNGQHWPNDDAIFGVYVIGSNVDKEGHRPDIDLLIVGNAEFDRRYSPRSLERDADWARLRETRGDWVLGTLAEWFRDRGFEVEIPEEIPSEYDHGLSIEDVKMMMRLKPPADSQASPIDIVYVKGNYLPRGEKIESFEDFYEVDTDSDGNALGRIALLEEEVKHHREPIRP